MTKIKNVVFDVEGPLVAPISASPKEAAAMKCMEMIDKKTLSIHPEYSVEYNNHYIKLWASYDNVYRRVVGDVKEAMKLLDEENTNLRDKALLYWQIMIQLKHPMLDTMKTWMLGAIYKGELEIESYKGVEHIPNLSNEGYNLKTLSGAPVFLQKAMLKKINIEQEGTNAELYSFFENNIHSGKKMKQQTYTELFEGKNIFAYVSDSLGENSFAKKAGAQRIFLTTTPDMTKRTIQDARREGNIIVDSIEEVVYQILR
ncbi:MAG: hypothetical protein ABH828_03215 [archaeon]